MMNETILEIARVVLSDKNLRERVLSELDITDEAALEALQLEEDGTSKLVQEAIQELGRLWRQKERPELRIKLMEKELG
jgi:hypothetical protein